MGYARHILEAIIKEFKEKEEENKKYYEDDGDRYRLGKADAFAEAANYILSEFGDAP